jgi:hypothetical protein
MYAQAMDKTHEYDVEVTTSLLHKAREEGMILKEKKEEWIESYFLQTSMYSFMLWERTGMLYPNIVVAIGVDERSEAQIFVRKAKDYLPKAKKMCIEYHERYENE